MAVRMDGHSVILTGGGEQGYEPALTHRFQLDFNRYPSGVGEWSADMGYAVRSFSPGKKVVEIGQFNIQNRVIQYPMKRGALPGGSLDLIVFGGKANRAYDFFWKWFRKVYNDDEDAVGLIGDVNGKEVDGQATVMVYGPGNKPIAGCTLDGIWPNTFGINDLNRRDDAEVVVAQVSFVINEWEWTYFG